MCVSGQASGHSAAVVLFSTLINSYKQFKFIQKNNRLINGRTTAEFYQIF